MFSCPCLLKGVGQSYVNGKSRGQETRTCSSKLDPEKASDNEAAERALQTEKQGKVGRTAPGGGGGRAQRAWPGWAGGSLGEEWRERWRQEHSWTLGGCAMRGGKP